MTSRHVYNCISPHHLYLPSIVIELEVLPSCEFKPAYAQPRKVKKYEGVYQVHESKVYPKDDTWFHMWHKAEKGNAEISKEVCVIM